MGSGQADIGAFNTLGYVNALNVSQQIEAIAKVADMVLVHTTQISGQQMRVFVIL